MLLRRPCRSTIGAARKGSEPGVQVPKSRFWSKVEEGIEAWTCYAFILPYPDPSTGFGTVPSFGFRGRSYQENVPYAAPGKRFCYRAIDSPV